VDPVVAAALIGVGGSVIVAVVGFLTTRAITSETIRASNDAARREIYARFLACAQRLLIVCEAAWLSDTEGAEASVETAHAEFFEAYAAMQIVGDNTMVDRARIYTYRLWELTASLGSTSVMGRENFAAVASLIRLARQDTIDAIRAGLGVGGSVRPNEEFNPFAGTVLEEKYADGERPRPGSAA